MTKKLLLLLLFLHCAFSFSQVRGTNETVTKPLPFNHNFQNISLDPTPVVGTPSRVQFVKTFSSNRSQQLGLGDVLNLIGGNVSIPGWVEDLVAGPGSWFCTDIQPRFGVNGSIDVGGYYEIHSVGNSDINVNYPVQVLIDYPAANTFACGETIRINTSYSVINPNDTKLSVKPPFVNQEIGPIIDNLTFEASIGVRARVGIGVDLPGLPAACEYVDTFNEGVSFRASTSLPQLPPLVNFCETGAFGPNANNATLFSCGWSSATPFLNLGQQVLDSFNSQYNTNYTFAEFPDQNTVRIAPPDLPTGAPPIPEVSGTFKNTASSDLTYSAQNNVRKLKVSGKKSSLSQMSFDLISLIDYTGFDTSLSLGGGLGSIDIGDIAPTLTIDQTFDFEYEPIVHLQVDLGLSMPYSVYNADNSLDHTGTGQIVDLIAGQYILATLPQGQTAAFNASGSSSMDGNFKSLSSQEYFRSLKVTFGEVKMAGVIDFKLLEEEVLKGKFGEKGILDHTMNLALPTSISLPNFVIDPENPIVDVTYLKSEDIINLGGGKRQAVYKVGITNQGDVNLSNVQSTINLATAFANSRGYNVVCITSSDLNVNTNFNGDSDQNLLAASNTLAVGQTKFIEFVVEVTPAVSAVLSNGCFGTVDYTIAAKATGTSPIGTNVQSDYNQCTMQITGDDALTSIDLGANRLNGLQDFTIYGWKGVVFDKPFAKSFGNVGSFTDLVFENVSLQNAPASVIVGDIHVKDRLRLIGSSNVIADYVQNGGTPMITTNSTLTTTGASSLNSSCVVTVPRLSITKPVNNSTLNITVASGATRTLTPGSYNTVSVSDNATLLLRPGVYNINTWRFMGNNAKVKYQLNNQSITIHVDKFQPLQRSNLQMTLDGVGKVSDVTIYSYGNQLSKFNNSFVQGVIIAPNAEVEFENNSKLEGSCYADKVNFKTGSVFKGTKFTLPLNVSSSCQSTTVQRLISDSTNVENSNSKNSILAYPNPVNDILNIEGLNENGATNVALFDLQGRKLRSYTSEGANLAIDMAGLNTGVYLLVIENSEHTIKVVKK